MTYKNIEENKAYQKKWRENHKEYLKKYRKTKGKILSKKYYQKNRLKILKKRKELYPFIKEKENFRSRIYHERNKDKINERHRIHSKKLEVKIRAKELRQINHLKLSIRDKTRYNFPIGNNLCKFCGNKATEHHHNTIPYQYDKFDFVCKNCHKIKDKELRENTNVYLEK